MPTTTAEIQEVNFALPEHVRCESCGAQAWVEVEIVVPVDDKRVRKVLNFCGHDYTKHKDVLEQTASRIVSHLDALYALERH